MPTLYLRLPICSFLTWCPFQNFYTSFLTPWLLCLCVTTGHSRAANETVHLMFHYCVHCYSTSAGPLPEHLVQAAFEESWAFHTEIAEVLQPEDLRGKLQKSLMVLFLNSRPMNRGEKEPLNIAHPAQERSKFGQGRQLLGEIQFHLLDTVQLHYSENFLNSFLGPWNNLYLLTAQVYGPLPLLHPPEEVGDKFSPGLFLKTKIYVHLQGSQRMLCPWHVLSHWCHQWTWGHMVLVSRPHVPEVLASISQVQHPQFALPMGKQKIW